MATFGATQHDLQAWQERQKLTMAQGADLLNAPYDTYRNWWYGHRKIPTPVALLMRYVETYGPLTRQRAELVRRLLDRHERGREKPEAAGPGAETPEQAAQRRLDEVRDLLERARDAVEREDGGRLELSPQMQRVAKVVIEARLFGNDPLVEGVSLGAARLGELASMSRPAVQRAVMKLMERPWFRVTATGHGNAGAANVYRIDAARLLEEAERT